MGSRTLSDVEQAPRRLTENAARGTARLALLLYHRDGVEVQTLTPGSSVLVGRDAGADLSVPEPTLSRQHARVEMAGDEVWIVDLGSANGTWLNGVRVPRARIRVGDDVTLGGQVALAIHTPTTFNRGLDHHTQFLADLREELTRCRVFQRQLGLLVLTPVRVDDASAFTSWSCSVRGHLRPVDRAALRDPSVLELMLPETGGGAAVAQAERIVRAAGVELRCGVALYPDSGRDTPEELLETALGALRCCSRRRPVVLARERGIDPVQREGPPPDGESVDLEARAGEAMVPVMRTASRVAAADLPVLIVGETGAGKEVVARAIHRASPRGARGPMRCINCGAIPPSLVQSTLFGHERGAFTGAARRQAGEFELAHGTTLLLDEIGELPAEAQVSLLRVLETGQVKRIGARRAVTVDVRILSATHRDLEAMCDAGTFRWDLYYRINPVTIEVPPLRRRRDEIEGLARGFVAAACASSGQSPRRIHRDALEILERYQWRGNVRELRNVMERAVIVAVGDEITSRDLPRRVREAVQGRIGDEGAGPGMRRSDETHRGHPRVEDSPFKNSVRAFEIRLIRRALARTGWNKTAAAEQLRLPLRTLMHKVRLYGLRRGEVTDDTRPAAALDAGPRLPFRERIRSYEARLLGDALESSGWNRAEAARRLGLPLSTVLYKIRSHALRPPG